MIYGYARVSTKKQVNGNSLEEQVNQLKAEGCELIIQEQYTGSTTERPEFEQLIHNLQAGDKLVVTKLDRFARSVREGTELIQQLIQKGIKVNILNLGVVDNKPVNKLMIDILLAFAEFERNMIIERTQAGKEIARTKNGFKDGRPEKYTECQLDHAMRLLNEGNSYKQVERMTTISKSTLIRYKRKQRAVLKNA